MKIGAVDRQQKANQNGTRRHDEHDDNRLDRALFDALCVTRAEILRREARHRGAEAIERRHQEVIDLVCRAKAILRGIRDHHAVQHVKLDDDALHHNDADRQHGELEAERDALDQMARHIMARDLPVLLMQAQLGIFGESIGKAAQRADELRAHRGDGRPGDTPAEHNDKQQVESHVQYRGEQQKRQRRHAVAHAAQERADEVIEQLITDLMQQKGYSKQQATSLIYAGGLSVYTTQDMRMQEAADTVLNDPDYYPGNNFTINYNLTVKETDGSFSYYSQNNMEKWYNDNGDSSFSLTLSNKEKAQNYIDTYKEAMTANGGTVTFEESHFVVQPQISFSVMEQSTGYVKVLVGGRGDKNTDRGLNRATDDVARQPGSSIKPLVAYGPGLDTGAITLASAIDDAPYYYSGTDARLVKNYTEGEYLGYITVRAALTRSQNVPAVKVLTQITPAVGFSYLQKFGLSTLVSPQNAVNGNHDVVQSLALGGMTKGVSNIDMTAAYAAIANKGVYTKPIYYTKVIDSEGNVIIDNSIPETHKVLKESSAWLLTSGMESVVSSGTATRAKVSNQPTAGKTGTTQFDTDIWFCGFTPYYTASIWVGYDDNSRQVSSVNHTSIWRSIMEQIHSGLPSGEFTKPEDIVEVQVCSKSGKLPVEGLCDQDPRGSCIITEYFTADNQPTESCDTHVKVNICNVSGDIANTGCTSVSTRILTKKPSSDSIGSNDSGYTTRDAEYSITEDKLTKLCTLHQRAATSSTNSSSGSTSTNNSNKNNSTTPTTSASGTTNSSGSSGSTEKTTKHN